ncbi:MAG: hypothetical protein GXO48_02500 [Chlorobi bacterium]|nr:hypothetical protein [Chlorobiota bacterium]
MKRITSIGGLLLAFALVMSSCSKEKKLERQLVGSWKVVKTSNEQTTAKGTITVIADLTGDCTFNKDKTGSCNLDGYFKVDGTVGPNNQPISFSYKVSGTYSIKEWDIQDGKLYITYDDNTVEVYFITEAGKDKFILEPVEGESKVETRIVGPDGTVIDIILAYRMELTRQ